MATESEYKKAISETSSVQLYELWTHYCNGDIDNSFWKDGKLFEYIILRAFELEIMKVNGESGYEHGGVTYPFSVEYPYVGDDSNEVLEQIDGAIRFDNLYALVECKCYEKNKIKVEPLSKMRNQLSRRHAGVFGMFFSKTPLTTPAMVQVQFMAPQLILLWSKEEIDFCMENSLFLECMKWKYKMAVEKCDYRVSFKVYKEMDFPKCEPLW